MNVLGTPEHNQEELYRWDDNTHGWAFADAQVAPREGETMADVYENNRRRYE